MAKASRTQEACLPREDQGDGPEAAGGGAGRA